MLILDRDFDGVEDLYDTQINESEISVKYTNYLERNPKQIEENSLNNNNNEDASTDDTNLEMR